MDVWQRTADAAGDMLAIAGSDKVTVGVGGDWLCDIDRTMSPCAQRQRKSRVATQSVAMTAVRDRHSTPTAEQGGFNTQRPLRPNLELGPSPCAQKTSLCLNPAERENGACLWTSTPWLPNRGSKPTVKQCPCPQSNTMMLRSDTRRTAGRRCGEI